MAWTKSTTTKHTCNDGKGPAFGRKTAGCPRCDELLDGAAPVVQAWRGKRESEDARIRREIAAHNCRRSNCGPVCTAFDW